MVDFFTKISGMLVKPLFSISGTEVTAISLIFFILVILATLLISRFIQRLLKGALRKKFENSEGTLAALIRLIHYFTLIIGFTISLQMVGINLSALFAAGAVFAIAIGFAVQNVAQNFVAGVILLLERSIKPGDVLEVEGIVVKVVDMGIRTTVVKTWKDEELIMPNSIISQSTVKNYTLTNSEFRLGVLVGVSYTSDVEKVFEVLESTAMKLPWGLADPPPRVMLQEFGASSLDFGVYVSIKEPWKQRVYMAELRKNIWFAFKEAGITIAYPQVDVHFDKEISDALTKRLAEPV